MYNIDLIKTKAFAELCDTTKRTIIYYDNINLLKPAARKGIFRWYNPKQVLSFQKISLLKSFGLTLSEIKQLTFSDSKLKQLFLDKRFLLETKKSTLEKRINKLSEFVNNLKKGKPIVVPKIKKVKPYSIYGVEKIGRYVDIENHQKELFNLLGDKKYKNIGLTIFFGSSYSPEKTRMITGTLINNKKPKQVAGVKIISFPSYKAVCYTHTGPYTYLSFVWQYLDKYLEENKLKRHPEIKCRELYIIGGLREKNKDNLVTELQIPIL